MPPELENKTREELAYEIVRMREEKALLEGGREELALEVLRSGMRMATSNACCLVNPRSGSKEAVKSLL